MTSPDTSRSLDREDREIYEWQMWIDEFGERGQRKLKNASVLVTRCGGLGGIVAYELAAAGIGKLVLAHAGSIKRSDLNRQLLMSYGRLGTSRMDSIVAKLRDFNPRVDVAGHEVNIDTENASDLVGAVDLVVDCAPRFEERFALNRAVVTQGKPMIECAVYEFDAQMTVILPGRTPCLQCLYPQPPRHWRREFPIFGAVSGSLGSMAAMEAIKVLSGVGTPLAGRLLSYDLKSMRFQTLEIERSPECEVCALQARDNR